MNILFVVPYVPSLIRVRPYHFIRQMVARGHQVTVATITTDERELAEARELESIGAEVTFVHLPGWRSLLNCALALPGREPLQAKYSWSSQLLNQAARVASRTDIVHVEHLRGARYGVLLKSALSPGTAVVWDSVDCISTLFEKAARGRVDKVGKLINRFELFRTRNFEAGLLSEFDRTLVTSGFDRASLLQAAQSGQRSRALRRRGDRSAHASAPVAVLPNGVDLDYFSPTKRPRDGNTLVFTGKMSYHANESSVIHFLKETMPLVRAKRPATRLLVVGKDPSRRLRRVVENQGEAATVTGTVPDIRPYLCQGAVAIVPLVYGAGCQNKVLEAMACAVPVVATPQAVSALNARPGQDLLVEEDPRAFASAVLALLGDSQQRHEIGNAGRCYVEANHRWDGIGARLEAIYEEVLSRKRSMSLVSVPA